MDAAMSLFDTLSEFKASDDHEVSPQRRLLGYCQRVFGAVERLHVEFKEKHDRSCGRLDAADKKNLARALSGFANSGGGVVIWGVEDKTLAASPIVEVERFLSGLLELAAQATDPPAGGVSGEWIPADTGVGTGFALVLVPESELPPHRVILRQSGIKDQYYIRSGSSFVVPSHAQLEDMFGRRPRPKLELRIRLQHLGMAGDRRWRIGVNLGIENTGRGSARAPMLGIEVEPPYCLSPYGLDGNGHVGLPELVSSRGSHARRFGASADVVLHPGVVHDVTTVDAFVGTTDDAATPSDLVIRYALAAENMAVWEGQETLTGRDLHLRALEEMSGRDAD